MADELIKVENLRRVDVMPGDRYVLMMECAISEESHRYILASWEKFIGGKVPLLVLPKGFELGVIRPQKVLDD